MATIQDSKHRRLEELSVSAARAYVESGLHGIEAEVVVVLDTSPGMAPLYTSGALQDVAAALLALAMKFDDDGVMPVWSFAREARHLGEIKRQDYASWVRHNVPLPAAVAPHKRAAAARFAPLIDATARRFFPREWAQKGEPSLLEPRAVPLFVIVVTAGDCDDAADTMAALRRASHLPIFWQFAGIALPDETSARPAPADDRERFRFLRGLDALSDTARDSVGFFMPGDAGDADELYRGLLNELPRWLALESVRAMLLPSEPPAAPDDGLDRLLLALPPHEAARREQARQERERRREQRARMAALELEQAAAWPTIRTSSETDSAADDPPLVRARGDSQARRMQVGTRPYITEDGIPPVLPPRRPTVSFAAIVEPAQTPSESEDEHTVETAIERLARIRARRNARRAD